MSNAPNGFPHAPLWAWSMRAAVFPGEGIDGGQLALLEMSDAQIREGVERFAERGINLIQTAGFHARFMWIPYLERITELNARITAAAHAAGLRVYDHHSSNGLWHEIEGRYRGWDPQSAVNVDIRTGLPLPKGKPKLICINNPEYQEHYDHYVLDLIAKTGVDGLMYDDVHFHRGQYGCGCRHCRSKFAERFGYEMPKPGEWPLDDYASAIWRDWIRFRVESAGERIVALREKLPTDFLYFSCMSAGVIGIDDVHHGGGSFEWFSRGTNCLFSEGGALYCRNELKWDRNLFDNWERLYVEKKYAGGIAAHHQQPSLQMHYPGNADDGWFAWAITKCMGMNLWRCDSNLYGGPKYGDEFAEWEPQYDYLNWEARHEGLWRYCRPVAEVGLLFSLQSKIHGGADPQPHGEAFAGWAQSLQRAGIFFNVLIDADLEDVTWLKGIAVLILPNAMSLSDRQVAVLGDYVRSGGRLIATHRSSLLDERGAPRGDFGLAEILGVHVGDRPPTLRSSLCLDRRRVGHPVGADLPPRLPMPTMVPLRWDGETSGRRAFAWLEKSRRSFEWPATPAIVENEVGDGQVLYLMPMVGSLAYREGGFPIWFTDPQHERVIEDVRKDESCWMITESKGTPANGKWMYVDEGLDGYQRLIVNAVRHFLPRPRVRVDGLPEGVLCELHRLAPDPGDTSDRGDRLVTLLNMTGALHRHGDWLHRTAQPAYPGLTGEVRLSVREPEIDDAQLFSPDLPEPLSLPVLRDGDGATIIVPLEQVARVAFVRLTSVG